MWVLEIWVVKHFKDWWESGNFSFKDQILLAWAVVKKLERSLVIKLNCLRLNKDNGEKE